MYMGAGTKKIETEERMSVKYTQRVCERDGNIHTVNTKVQSLSCSSSSQPRTGGDTDIAMLVNVKYNDSPIAPAYSSVCQMIADIVGAGPAMKQKLPNAKNTKKVSSHGRLYARVSMGAPSVTVNNGINNA